MSSRGSRGRAAVVVDGAAAGVTTVAAATAGSAGGGGSGAPYAAGVGASTEGGGVAGGEDSDLRSWVSGRVSFHSSAGGWCCASLVGGVAAGLPHAPQNFAPGCQAAPQFPQWFIRDPPVRPVLRWPNSARPETNRIHRSWCMNAQNVSGSQKRQVALVPESWARGRIAPKSRIASCRACSDGAYSDMLYPASWYISAAFHGPASLVTRPSYDVQR